MKSEALAGIAAIVLGLMLCATATPAAASEIYKWTDENGNIHFGDKPEGDRPERVAIVSRATDRAAVSAQIAARNEARAERAEQEAAAAAAGPTAEEKAAEAADRARQCATYRDRMQKMVASRRIYRENADGERVYLDEAEMLAARQQVEDQVSEYCNT